MRQAIGKWRAVVENEFLGALSLALINGFLKSARFFPVFEGLLLYFRKRRARVYAESLTGRVLGDTFLGFLADVFFNL